jgi:hypothetical protein
MTQSRSRDHDHLRVMIEQMQRAGHHEDAIHDAVRRATARRPLDGPGPAKRPGRFGLFGRRRRP